MSIALYALICTATLAVLADAQDVRYCNLQSCKDKPHTACLYSAQKAAPTCGKVLHVGVSEAEKKDIVNAHNSLRANVANGKESRGNPGPQPASQNIHNLTWSDELATIAQAWANQCDFNHDECRNALLNYAGQNLATASAWGQDPDTLISMIQGWYDEVQYVDRRLVSSFAARGGPAIGHYTQLVWGETTQVGCGVIVYNNDKKWITTYLVCNYGPGGNIIGRPIY